jgi:hypothetical protein
MLFDLSTLKPVEHLQFFFWLTVLALSKLFSRYSTLSAISMLNGRAIGQRGNLGIALILCNFKLIWYEYAKHINLKPGLEWY